MLASNFMATWLGQVGLFALNMQITYLFVDVWHVPYCKTGVCSVYYTFCYVAWWFVPNNTFPSQCTFLQQPLYVCSLLVVVAKCGRINMGVVTIWKLMQHTVVYTRSPSGPPLSSQHSSTGHSEQHRPRCIKHCTPLSPAERSPVIPDKSTSKMGYLSIFLSSSPTESFQNYMSTNAPLGSDNKSTWERDFDDKEKVKGEILAIS